jgi:hypothetical protein
MFCPIESSTSTSATSKALGVEDWGWTLAGLDFHLSTPIQFSTN